MNWAIAGLYTNPVPGDRAVKEMEQAGGAGQRAYTQAGAAATSLSEAALRSRERGSQMVAQGEMNALLAGVGDDFYNRDTGYMHQREAAALDTEGTQARIDKRIADGLARITDPRARELFQQRAAEMRIGWADQIQKHAGAQLRAHANSLDKGAFDNAMQTASLAPGDQAVLDAQLRESENALQNNLDLDGKPIEVVEAIKSARRADIVKASLEPLMTEETIGQARAFFNANKERLGAHAAALEKKIETLELPVKVRGWAQEIVIDARADENHPWLDPGKALKAVDEMEGITEYERKLLGADVRHRVADNHAVRAADAKEVFGQGHELLEKYRYNLNAPGMAAVLQYLDDPLNDGTNYAKSLRDAARAEARRRGGSGGGGGGDGHAASMVYLMQQWRNDWDNWKDVPPIDLAGKMQAALANAGYPLLSKKEAGKMVANFGEYLKGGDKLNAVERVEYKQRVDYLVEARLGPEPTSQVGKRQRKADVERLTREAMQEHDLTVSGQRRQLLPEEAQSMLVGRFGQLPAPSESRRPAGPPAPAAAPAATPAPKSSALPSLDAMVEAFRKRHGREPNETQLQLMKAKLGAE